LQAQVARCWVAILFGGCLAEKGERWVDEIMEGQ
jgi:hypothetical protein